MFELNGRLGRATIETTMNATRIRNFVCRLISNGGIANIAACKRQARTTAFGTRIFDAVTRSVDGDRDIDVRRGRREG